MRALQLHVDSIEYEPVGVEGRVFEEVDKRRYRVEEAIVLFTSVERDDTPEVASEMLRQVAEFMQRLGVKRLLIYPYAHLSPDLARPEKALEVLRRMEMEARSMGLEVYRAPFGWNKRFTPR